MTQHTLQGRTEKEILWFQRRDVIKAAAAWAAMGGLTLNTVSLLRMVTGAVASVWTKGGDRAIITPTLTAGIRGTGVYTEVVHDQDSRTYFCNCYGTVELFSGDVQKVSEAQYHQSFWSQTQGAPLSPAGAINHSDEELEFLAQLIGQRTAWQIMGRKGVKDGKGLMGY